MYKYAYPGAPGSKYGTSFSGIILVTHVIRNLPLMNHTPATLKVMDVVDDRINKMMRRKSNLI